MCGIAGATSTHPSVLDEQLARLAHRGPDGNGVWHDPESGAGLAHARLAIIDLTTGGTQPMVSPCERWVMAFNGEIYNYQSLRSDLESQGETFVTSSDTEVLLRLLMRQGLESLPKLAGMFAIALWDRAERSLVLIRDRFGVKPLVWSPLPSGGVAFASEIHALAAQPGVDLTLDPQALSQYLACLYVPAPLSMHQGIRKLAPGSWLAWRDGRISMGRWWRPQFGNGRALGVDEAVEEVAPLIETAVRRRLVADVEVGCFLSGGIDSSVIAAIMAKIRREQGAPPPRTFTMTFDEAAYDERIPARAIADHLGTTHVELPASPQSTDFLDDMVRLFGEPFGNPTALLIHDLSQMTRRHVSVALAGDGGDEVFAGYPRYRGGMLAARLDRALPAGLRRGLAWGAGMIPESSQGRHGWRRAREFLGALGQTPAQRYGGWVEYFNPGERQELLELAGLPSSPIAELYESLRLNDPLDAMQATDLQSFLPGNLLSYGDAMSMAVALETRLPFLDHDLVTQVGSIAAATRVADGPKTLLKAVARRYLPAHIVDRPKLGFNPPMGVWLKGALKPLVEERLVKTKVERLGLAWTPVARLLTEHRAGRRDHSLKVWSLLVLDAWMRAQEQKGSVP